MPEPKYNREDYKKAREPREEKPDAQDLVFHLDELRKRIFIGVLTLVLTVCVCFYLSEPIIIFLEAAAPQGSSFYQIKPGELFMASLKVSVYFGLIVSLPVLLWQIYLFAKPGLKDNENSIIKPLVFISPLLFWFGQVFAYFFILPALVEFLFGFRKNIVETRYSLEHFLNLEISILSVCGISFLLPMLIFILGQFGLVSSKQLFKAWRYVVLGAFVVSAVITPTPDPFTMSILAFALLSLYFLTVIILKVSKK